MSNRIIHIVIGPPGSGKSTAIRERLGDLTCIDLWDYQGGIQPTQKEVIKSYVRHRRTCIDYAKQHPSEDFVIEHTLMKARRRVYYVHRLAPYGALWCWSTTNGGMYPEEAKKVYEPPTLGEGFSVIRFLPDWKVK